ncbi:hypothetical protein TRVL_06472 [Trypanosoma vivax]|uniref:Uncharacterized protein n=1 Tax=Trypanosoma vivax (strain Y486) TaxID=1055687 RepID=G0U976_TRYVY|nr:hypothetical protein TRVL_06472 [Trypanosoma vivax]CCC54160.1 hypothetical protein TVY486_1116440 [Trypanosoma vivax Y486]
MVRDAGVYPPLWIDSPLPLLLPISGAFTSTCPLTHPMPVKSAHFSPYLAACINHPSTLHLFHSTSHLKALFCPAKMGTEKMCHMENICGVLVFLNRCHIGAQ